MLSLSSLCLFFFFNDTATTEIYTLSLHDALPISLLAGGIARRIGVPLTVGAGGLVCLLGALMFAILVWLPVERRKKEAADRKSTRLNSSHGYISYAVFCLKKKKRT